MPFLCVLRGANHENVRTTRRIFGPRITQITRMRADHSRHSGDSRVTFPSLSFRMFVAPLLVAASPRCVLCVEVIGVAVENGSTAYPTCVSKCINGFAIATRTCQTRNAVSTSHGRTSAGVH
ncbi:hypothetical protein CfE428DRAFT_2437 [Chthoniobacter flavus Ellin428]|uniref:Uncharacterized protein n=1 Tax=Chthoniobacter flavus Ellin428 TaxID=497964 RepID=B4D0I6_9BACT|nr:hypothetical protein CfE428DRAFT_2437 [Chthoniobacter flavus Ellin428]